MKPRLHSSEHGFTLIEIMVALVILAGLSVMIAQSIKTGLQSKAKIQLQIEEESALRDAMRLIAGDIASAFHHRDFTVSTYNQILELRKKSAAEKKAEAAAPPADGAAPADGSKSDQAQAPDPLASATPMPTPRQLTGFVGTGDGLLFTVKNHVRRFIDAQESDQAKISYSLQNCRSEGKRQSQSRCLVRAEKTVLDTEFKIDSLSRDENSVALIQNVTTFKLRYIEAGQKDFVDDWDSTKSDKKGNFPDAVEVTLAIHDQNNPKSKPYAMTMLAPLRFTNNIDPSENKSNAEAGTIGKPQTPPAGAQK
jgi:prepilin-type N-terminal cleavage/methylation domain-containing protein